MIPGRTYHVYNHGNADDNLFRCEENFHYFLTKYTMYSKPIADSHAYCLLPNHFHLLLTVKADVAISRLKGFEGLTGLAMEEKIVKQFSNFFNGYTKAFNKMYNRRGKLFLTPFKRKPVLGFSQFINTVKYIHNNPVRHQFVKDPFEWTFSSIHYYRNKTLKRDYIPSREDFIEFD